jgi:branched-chain amino acid transport system permease protein
MRRALLAAALLVAVAVPFVLSPFRVGQLTTVLVFAVALIGLNLVVGYAGQISLAHGALFALGAYATGALVVDAGLPWPVALVLAGALSLVAGLVLGLPALRLRGHYLALVTLGVTVATPQLVKRLDGVTGGSSGLSVPQPAPPAWLGLAPDQFLYLLSLGVALVMLALAAGLVRGRTGRALVAVRTNEIAARANGVDLAATKVRAFGASALYAGVAGGLYALTIGFLAPESFTLALSFGFLAAIVVGGLATLSGAIVGALFLQFVPAYTADVSEALAGVIYGAVVMGCMYALPGGAVGAALRLRPRHPHTRRSHEEEEEEGHEHPHQVAAGGLGARRSAGGHPRAGRVRP